MNACNLDVVKIIRVGFAVLGFEEIIYSPKTTKPRMVASFKNFWSLNTDEVVATGTSGR
jgi:hypothetical protein